MNKHLSGSWFRKMLLPLMVLSLAMTGYFSIKTYRTFHVLQTARALDMPEVGNIRAWMTIDYVATSYRTPVEELLSKLELPPKTDPSTTLGTISDEANIEVLVFVQRVQRVFADMNSANQPIPEEAEASGWFDQLMADSLSALLLYGYPILAIILFLGALGLPLPAGPITAVAGTLALQGDINWVLACSLAVTASVLGDLFGYGAGRMLSPRFLERWGHWVGYTKPNQERLRLLYENWGGLTLILTRSLVAYIGVIASILAGAGRYRFNHFFLFSLIGRLIWTASYFGLGYAVGSDFEVASGFLGYLSLLLISLAMAIGSGMLFRRLQGAPGLISK